MKRPLVILIIFFLFGITVSNTLFTFPPEWLAKLGIPALILVLLLAAASIKSSRLFYSVLCLFFFLLGIFRYSASIEPGKEDISYFLDASSQKALVHGTVTNDPESKDFRHMVFLLKAEQLLSGGEEHAVTGSVRVDLFNPREVPIIGDKIVVGGKLSLPKGKMNPAGFDYKRYLSHMGVHAVILSSKSDDYMRTGIQKGPVISMRRAISSARRKADKIISMFLAGEAKSITRSVILGLRGGIDDATNDIFVKTGTMHILAVSGLHIGIVGMVILGLLRLVRLPRNASYVITILGICAFAIFA
ncbi:MAG: ComEC/Rec2 family competence protein, partial [Candidatus Omnitrophota bacterium]